MYPMPNMEPKMTTNLTPAAAQALHQIVADRGATVHPAIRAALQRRDLVRLPFWNQPNYCRATAYGKDVEYRMRKGS